MRRWFETVTDLNASAATLSERRYGVIEVIDGRLTQIVLRPWPKRVWLFQAWIAARLQHKYLGGDRCWLYYNQPRLTPAYLAVPYMLSAHETRLTSIQCAVQTLEQIAAIKGCDAILCDAANPRITDRVMRRFGYVSHAPMWLHRNYIKRLYESRPSEPYGFDVPCCVGEGV